MEMNFCRRCGQPLKEKAKNFWLCQQSHSTYLNPSPAAGVFFITDDHQVLLSRRGIEPGKGMLDSFGGFVDTYESSEQAIEREIMEETGLSSESYEPLRIFCTAPMDYLYEEELRPVLSTFFWTRLHPDAQITASDDVAEVVSLPLKNIDLSLFHGEDVKKAISILQNLPELQ